MFIGAHLKGEPLPIHGDGRQTRSLTFADDAVELVLCLAKAKSERLVPVNVGNDDERSIHEMASLFAQIAAASLRTEFVPARPGDPQRRRPDLERARSFGWHPKPSLRNGLGTALESAALEQDICT